MSHPLRRLLHCAFFLAGTTTAQLARGGAIDSQRLRDELEEQVQDGDIDAEDLEGFRLARQGAAGRRGSAYLALAGFGGDHLDGNHEVGVMLILHLPLERFTSGAPPALAFTGTHPGAPAEATSLPLAADPLPTLGLLQDAGAPPPAAPLRVETPVVVTAELARACVRAALRTMGLADDARLDSLASRARASAALPELRLRLARTIDESGRLTLTDADPDRYTAVGAATNWLEARLTFRLDRLLFADDEISLERVRIERSELRSRTSAKVLQALFEWQRAYALTLDSAASTSEHFAAVLRELEARAILDVMTDGWFGRSRATQAASPP